MKAANVRFYAAAAEMGQCAPVVSKTEGFIRFANRIIDDLRLVGRQQTAERYEAVRNSFARFLAARGDVALCSVDASLVVAYECYLKSAGVCPNTSSFYMRGLRAIYNRAVEESLTWQRNPFKHVYTGVDKTVKRAVPLEIVRRLRDLDLAAERALDLSRDLFMFSFYTRGMSFVDMAYLRKSDLKNGILSYRRRKTGQLLCVKWERPMQDIVCKYAGRTTGTPYLLPIIRGMKRDGRRQYKTVLHHVNRHLKTLGEMLGLSVPLTTYVARHTWASIAKSKNIPLAVISEAMGHDSEKTTLIYLTSLDASAVDNANSAILDAL